MSATWNRATRTKRGFTRLYCDVRECRRVIDGDDAASCRRTGRELGWTREAGRDYCPEHS